MLIGSLANDLVNHDDGSPSHIALSCSGVLPETGRLVGFAVLVAMKIGFVSVPMLLGILADPSTIAEKLTPMNRRIISCVM